MPGHDHAFIPKFLCRKCNGVGGAKPPLKPEQQKPIRKVKPREKVKR